ncbi:MAG TPA: Zn-ribbon domain-containing OB-fold protein [Mycobacteriales bacterium]|nr:Zn-ribbon domain-containing OB-fold protein [Mycobacteriales bacterium]
MSEPTKAEAGRDPRKEPKPRPAPVPEQEAAQYWAAALEGKLLVQRCTACNHHQLYPRVHCLVCRSPVEWIESAGTGTVYSRTIIRQNMSRSFRHLLPYVVALVDLDEGPRLMTNIVNVPADDVQIGDRVRVRFEPVSDQAALPLFEPDLR